MMRVLLLLGLQVTFLLSTQAIQAFDHTYKNYAKLLESHVTVKGAQSTVNYQKIKSNQNLLNEILSSWEKLTQEEFKKWAPNQQLAFLINAYNGFTIKLIVDHYPVKSIKDIGTFFSSPWKKEFFNLFGKKTHLDHIEHELIRKNFKEPRIHFAVNCASLGCPSLAKEPFQADKLDRQLEGASKTFIQNSNRNRLDPKSKTAYLSKIFKWYGDDFEKMTGKDFKVFISKFLPEFRPKEWQIDWLSYDWNLNDNQKEKSK